MEKDIPNIIPTKMPKLRVIRKVKTQTIPSKLFNLNIPVKESKETISFNETTTI